jgi:hypothetical protein
MLKNTRYCNSHNLIVTNVMTNEARCGLNLVSLHWSRVKGAQVCDFDLLDSNDFDIIKSLWVGDLRAKIKI